MEWLNYHHLHYFWMVAREGGLAGAAAKLRLSPPTLSAQINALEAALGEDLFEKQGRRLVLTDTGQVAYRYAEEIFSLGRELLGTVHGGSGTRPLRLTVGVGQSVPKLIARMLLEPVRAMTPEVYIVCREEPPERLLAELAIHALDVVLTDAPGQGTANVRVYNHMLGESTIAIFGTDELASEYKRGFPRSLDGAPFLLPTHASATRGALEAWFDEIGVRPKIVAEFDDGALLKAFAQDGMGLCAAPSVITAEIKRQHRVRRLGLAGRVKERFYALTCERKLKHPALVRLTESARRELFTRKSGRAAPRRKS
jgi:LysR family transcriptional regulator, transcriptional activator of nhaA